MSKKALIVATVGRFYSFVKGDISILKQLGYDVHVATNMTMEPEDRLDNFDVVKHQVDFARSPFSKNTFIAYKQLKKLLKNGDFNLIHCHTPVGGILTRLTANKYRKNGTKVIYTAHGFHFYKGAPIKNWLIFYPIEKFCSRFTDVLITINKEDYNLARKDFKAKKVEYIPGVGVDLERFNSEKYDAKQKRIELDVDDDVCMALSVGELSDRKNHEVVIKAISELPDEYSKKIKYFIVGKGDLEEYLKSLCKQLGVNNICFLGHRTDIPELCSASDVFLFPSKQEGLPVALMEAMACGLPCVASNIRGNVDLLDSNGGYLCNPFSIDEFKVSIEQILKNSLSTSKMKEYNLNKIRNFDVNYIMEFIKKIYLDIQ